MKPNSQTAPQLQALQDGLIVSCQSLPGSPMDRPDIIAAMAQAAVAGGAVAVRIEGLANTRAVAAAVTVPIIGIIKRDLSDSAVRITPFVQDVKDLAAAGASIIAFDATRRSRPEAVADLLRAAHALGCLAMADCADLDDGLAAWQLGCDLIGTTLSGYTEATASDSEDPDFKLVRELSTAGCRVVAEGRLRTPAQAAQAMREGACCVTIGSAITRIEHTSAWFAEAISQAASA